MNYEVILYDVTDGLATITMNRPATMNALTAQMRAELKHAFERAAEEARATVLTGAGNAFCAGQDLSDQGNTTDMELERALRDEYNPLVMTITNSPVPTMAVVNGPAAGAGANLALACDVVIATESAYILQAFSRIGLVPDAGGTWTMPRQIGLARAMGAALFADKISAKQAMDWGMIWEAVPDDEFEATWKARAATLAAGPTKSYLGIKTAIRASFDNNLQEQLELESKMQGMAGRTRDFREGVLAFLQKRKAKFQGR